MDNDYIQLTQTELNEYDCDQIINTAEQVIGKYNITRNKNVKLDKHDIQYSQFMRQDTALFMPLYAELTEISYYIVNLTNEGLREYLINNPSLMSSISDLSNSTLKYQKTPKNGGYHKFHTEHTGTMTCSSRVLAWTLYLNNFSEEERGETEFLHFNRRISPKAGALAIWPAYWPWVHRGNPPEKDKHIITGWFHHGVIEHSVSLPDLMKA